MTRLDGTKTVQRDAFPKTLINGNVYFSCDIAGEPVAPFRTDPEQGQGRLWLSKSSEGEPSSIMALNKPERDSGSSAGPTKARSHAATRSTNSESS